jgi:hypothetical protein
MPGEGFKLGRGFIVASLCFLVGYPFAIEARINLVLHRICVVTYYVPAMRYRRISIQQMNTPIVAFFGACVMQTKSQRWSVTHRLIDI